MAFARSNMLSWLFRAVGLVALASAAFLLPHVPSLGLDSAWQMALGKFFVEGRRFGTEIVFTYGPLGWTMGNMYSGLQWSALLLWHAALALVMAAVVLRTATQLSLPRRILLLVFFFLFGLRYEDVQQHAAIVILGLELIRRAGEPRWSVISVAMLALFAVFSLVKFTNLVLVAAFIFFVSVRAFTVQRERRWSVALRAPGWFAGLFGVGWLLCGQHLGDLPAYFINSWSISSGYQDAMGWSCPSIQLYHGLAVVALLVVYLGLVAWTDTDRLRGATLALAAGSYIYLNWKHGFIRADGHQLVFYFAALLLALGSPLLLADSVKWRVVKQTLLVLVALLALRGAELATPGLLAGALPTLQARVSSQLAFVRDPAGTRAGYDRIVENLRAEVPLPRTRALVGGRSVDVLGFEQDVAILNQLNYAPRPVFQSYSAYTPLLARLNREHYESDRAPEYVLLKLHSVDQRLETMDDALVTELLPQHYHYLFTERGFALWQRKPGPPAPLARPTPLRSTSARLGQPINMSDLPATPVWVQIEFQLNLLGQLRRLLFKPPLVHLRITDETGATQDYRLPRPIAANGFMLSPLIHDIGDFLRAANGESGRRATSIAIQTSPQDADCFKDHVLVHFASAPVTPGAGWPALPLGTADAPLTFVRGHAPFGAQLSQVEGELEYYAHAPSSLVYRPAERATHLAGSFGLYGGAYAPENASPSDGVEFIVRWIAPGGLEKIIFRQLVRPREIEADRKQQSFRVTLPPDASSGELEFKISPGPDGNSASDWAYWRHLRLETSH